MKETKIAVCSKCKEIYTEPKTTHCKEKHCDREQQAVIVINSKLFWDRIGLALSTGIHGDIHGIVRRAGRRTAVPKVEDVENAKPKVLTGAISE